VKLRVALVGATGLVGQECLKVLHQRNFPLASLNLFASDRSTGRKVRFGDEELPIQELAGDSFRHTDIAFFGAGADVSRHHIPLAVKAGAVCIDKSAIYRMEPGVPLVVPEVNGNDLAKHRGIIASPNCSTIQFVMAIHPIHKFNPIKRAIVDTYQSVSGTGSAAMEELSAQTKLVMEGKGTVPHVYPHQIAFNVLPQVEVFMGNGYTTEEWKMVQETQKILHDSKMSISSTCARVPVFIGHSEAAHLELTRPTTVEEVHRWLSEAPGVKVLDELNVNLYPHAWAAVGRDEVFVGRLRLDVSHPTGLAMWIVADNLRKGAALNAVQIAEELAARSLVG